MPPRMTRIEANIANTRLVYSRNVKVSTTSPGYAALSKCPSLLISRSPCTTAAAAIRESGSLHPQTRRNFIVSSIIFRENGMKWNSFFRNLCSSRASSSESFLSDRTSISVTMLIYRRRFLNIPQKVEESILSFKRLIRIFESKINSSGIIVIPLIAPAALECYAVFVKNMGELSGHLHHRPPKAFFSPPPQPRNNRNPRFPVKGRRGFRLGKHKHDAGFSRGDFQRNIKGHPPVGWNIYSPLNRNHTKKYTAKRAV